LNRTIYLTGIPADCSKGVLRAAIHDAWNARPTAQGANSSGAVGPTSTPAAAPAQGGQAEGPGVERMVVTAPSWNPKVPGRGFERWVL